MMRGCPAPPPLPMQAPQEVKELKSAAEEAGNAALEAAKESCMDACTDVCANMIIGAPFAVAIAFMDEGLFMGLAAALGAEVSETDRTTHSIKQQRNKTEVRTFTHPLIPRTLTSLVGSRSLTHAHFHTRPLHCTLSAGALRCDRHGRLSVPPAAGHPVVP